MSPVEHATDQSSSPAFSTPAMTAEGEMAMLIDSPPIRMTGFIALLLGLISFAAVLGQPLLVFPVLAIVLALIALRPYSGPRPTGYLAASIGLFCAILFGSWGITERALKLKFMGDHATVFAADWLDLLARGEVEMAAQLQTDPTQRQPDSMPLTEFYRDSEQGKQSMASFRENTNISSIIYASTAAKWKLARGPAYFTDYGRQITATGWKDEAGIVDKIIKIEMEYIPPKNAQPAQWQVTQVSQWADPS